VQVSLPADFLSLANVKNQAAATNGFTLCLSVFETFAFDAYILVKVEVYLVI
jgi:hypothetical protein